MPSVLVAVASKSQLKSYYFFKQEIQLTIDNNKLALKSL